MHRRLRVGLGCFLLLGLAVGVRIYAGHRERAQDLEPPGPVPAADGSPDARLAGRPPAAGPAAAPPERTGDAPPPRSETPCVRGRFVVEPGDHPVERRVYLVPKGSRGERVFHQVRVRAEAEDDGSWALTGDPRGQWIAGLAAGYLPVFVDGDAWAGEEVVLDPARGRRIEVSVRAVAADLQPDLHVHVEATEEAALEYPGPGSLASIPTHAPFGRGVHTRVYASMTGRVRVQVGALGFVVRPTEIVLGPDEDEAAFVVTQGCRVDLHVHDAETRLPLAAEVYVGTQPQDGSRKDSVYYQLEAFAEYMEMWGVLPGAYHVEVHSRGFLPWRSERLELSRPGDRVVLDAGLEPDPAFGRLLLEVVPPEGGTLAGAQPSVVLVPAGSVGRGEWEAVPPRAVSADRKRVLLAGLVPGDIHLLAWTGPVAVGWIGNRTVRAGRTETVRLALQRGTLVRLLGTRKSHEGFYVGEVAPVLRSPEGVDLPLAWFWSRMPQQPDQQWWPSSPCDFRDELVRLCKKANSDAVLGPFPFSDIQVLGARADLVPNDR